VITIGDLVVDLITAVTFPIQPGHVVMTQPAQLEPGGACNFAIAAARLGLEVSVMGAPGDDIYGKLLMDVLTAEGVNTGLVRQQTGARTTLVQVLADPVALTQTYISSHVTTPGAYPFDENVRKVVNQARALYVQGYALCEDYLWEVTREAMRTAKKSQIPIYFDPSPMFVDAQPRRKNITLDQADVLLITEDELPLLDPTGQVTTPDALCDLILQKRNVHTIVVKQGAKGCRVVRWTRNGQYWKNGQDFPAFPVKAIGSSGAGDAFNAGYVAGRLHGWSVENAAQLANAVGAAKVTKLGGGRNVPTRQQVSDLLKANNVTVSFEGW
jgi:sugar/nucleoside kinase (ribokinase family)